LLVENRKKNIPPKKRKKEKKRNTTNKKEKTMSNYYDAWEPYQPNDRYAEYANYNGYDSYDDENANVGDEQVYAFIKRPGTGYLVIHADWCGHCKRLLKELGIESKDKEQIPDSLFPGVHFAEDSTISKELKNKFNVEGFPTVLKFVNGKQTKEKSDYRDEMINHVHSLSGGSDAYDSEGLVSLVKTADVTVDILLEELMRANNTIKELRAENMRLRRY
jgi:thiol-disulfide isomerase/thioredoxin